MATLSMAINSHILLAYGAYSTGTALNAQISMAVFRALLTDQPRFTMHE